MTRAYVSVGSNVDRVVNIGSAVRALRDRYGRLDMSSVYETRSVGFKGGNFYNMVIGFDTEEEPPELVRGLKAIEDASGRARGGPRFADRTLDLDLILYGSRVSQDAGVVLPRREILEQSFVLGPLAEIARDEAHPVLKRTYGELWADFDPTRKELSRVEFPFPLED